MTDNRVQVVVEVKSLISIEELAAQLQDYKSPRICPLCLALLSNTLSRTNLLDDLRQPKHHCFWNACIAVVTAPRTDEDLSILRARLRANMAACKAKDLHPRQQEKDRAVAAIAADPVHLLIHAVYGCLHGCLMPQQGKLSSLFRPSGPKKSFGSKRRLWPTHPNDFIPFGARQSAEMHVRWCCELFSPMPVACLTGLVLGCRPLLYPHLLESPLRERLVWCLAQMFYSDVMRDDFQWPATVPHSRPDPLPPWLCQSTSYESLEQSGRFVYAIIYGPDARSEDSKSLFNGLEAGLIPAANCAIDTMDKFPKRIDQHDKDALCNWAVQMHDARPDAPMHRLAEIYDAESWQDSDDAPPYEIMLSRLIMRYYRRSCCGPSCTRGIHETEDGKPLPLCAGCKFTQYCCKGCQKADWKHERWPHKDLCPMLAMLIPALQNTSVKQFEELILSDDFHFHHIRMFMSWIYDAPE